MLTAKRASHPAYLGIEPDAVRSTTASSSRAVQRVSRKRGVTADAHGGRLSWQRGVGEQEAELRHANWSSSAFASARTGAPLNLRSAALSAYDRRGREVHGGNGPRKRCVIPTRCGLTVCQLIAGIVENRRGRPSQLANRIASKIDC
jgi:hypothetical protein